MFRLIAISLIAFYLIGCNESHQNERFDEFLSLFMSNKSFELSRTIFPLSSYRYEYGIDENGNEESAVIKTEVAKSVAANQLTLSEYLSQNDLSSVLLGGDNLPNIQIIKVFKQGTDWLIEYHFEKSDGQWFLVETHDYSL